MQFLQERQVKVLILSFHLPVFRIISWFLRTLSRSFFIYFLFIFYLFFITNSGMLNELNEFQSIAFIILIDALVVQNWPVGTYSGAQMSLSLLETALVIFDSFLTFWYGKVFKLILKILGII